MDTMTQGAREAIAENVSVAKWAVKALRSIKRDGSFPDMIIGDPKVEEAELQDEGRTLKLPVKYSEKLYACINETGGATIMLASEY